MADREKGGRFQAVLGILDFFIPADVLSSVLLIFTMENVLDHAFAAFIPPESEGLAWLLVYMVGLFAVSGLNYATADQDEREDLSDDLDDL